MTSYSSSVRGVILRFWMRSKSHQNHFVYVYIDEIKASRDFIRIAGMFERRSDDQTSY